MQINKKTYHSKVLLFGEYLILEQAKALAVPFPEFSGAWKFVKDPESQNPYYKDFLRLLDFMHTQGMNDFIELEEFEEAIRNGLCFDSTIKTGYGTGSSGAVVAGVYDQFLKKNKATKDFAIIRARLSAIESFFHGNSSGLDPLVSYFDQALLVDNDKSVSKVEFTKPDLSYYLLDSGKSRSTQPLVKIFKQKKQAVTFIEDVLNPLTMISDRAIDQFIANDAGLMDSILQISKLQFEGFQEMILAEFKEMWKKGLESNTFALKLCGAGGGGFYLAIGDSQDIENNFDGNALKLF